MSQPNYKARLNRANRNNVPVQSATESFKRFKWFTLALVILSPIYPSLAAIGETNQYGVTIVDDSSILAEFTDTANLKNISEDGFVTGNTSQTDSEEIPANVDTKMPVPESNVRLYTVVEHDDIIKISKKYNIAADVILWSNGLTMNDTLVEGQQLKIPPVSGVVHTLRPGETVSDIAKKYNVSVGDILSANNISDARKIQDGTRLMIPGAVIAEPVVEKKTTTTQKQSTQKTETQKTTPKKEVSSSKQVATPKAAATTTTINPTT